MGGLFGLWFEGEDEEGNLKFVIVLDWGFNGVFIDVDDDGENERLFVLLDY